MSTIRLLIKPAIFTLGVCGTCFCGAAILEYENRRKPFPPMQDWILAQRQRSIITHKYLTLRDKINSWKNNLTTGEKIAGCTIFMNFLVLCAWRSNRLRPVMSSYFTSQVSKSKIPLSPMILSCFSHSEPLHFAFNMYVMYSFSNIATTLLGPEQLIGLFLGAGVASSLTSIACRLATRRVIPSLGASGALLGVVGYICMARPDLQLLLFFIPVTAGNAIKLIMTMDFVGLIARWKLIDHAAHLGGSSFGIWYGYQGEGLFYQYRGIVVDKWLKLKKKYN